MDRNIEESFEKMEKRSYAPIGTIGLERYGGYIMEEFISNLRMPQCLKIYKEMSSNDATIGGILLLIESMMRKLPYSVEAGGDKRVDKKMAEFVTQCMHDMEHSWLDFIVEVLSMFPYGWSWHEIIYKIRTDNNSKYPDGRIGWAKLPIRSQNSWSRWIYADNNPDELIGMEQRSANSREVVIIPYEKSLLFRTKSYRNSPEGVSLLRNAYRPYHFKKKIEELEGIGIERDLAGLPVMKVPAELNLFNADDPDAVTLKTYLEKLISNIRRDKNEGVLIPDNYEFELQGSKGQRQFDTSKIIDRWDQRIAMTLLADLILMGHQTSGSFALAKEKKNLLAASMEAHADNILNVINTVAIPRLIKLNTFTGYTEFPRVIRGEIETPDTSKLADSMQKFEEMGMMFFPNEKTEKYIRECLGLPNLSEKEKKELEAAKEEKKKELEQAEQTEQNKLSTKPLPPRKTKEHETDDKDEFNETYEEAGIKKLFDKLFRRNK
jgi:hypothetical protein